MPIRYDTLMAEARAARMKIVNRDRSGWSIISSSGSGRPPRAIAVKFAREDGTSREIHWREKGGYPFGPSPLVTPRRAATDNTHLGNVSGIVDCDRFSEAAILELYRHWLENL